jgi:sugar phosphate isomerase/epimerase
MQISRRQFLNQTTAGMTAAGVLAALPLSADPLGLPLACQTYPVREALGKDLEGTLAQLASLGYKNIEMCSPLGYEKSGFGTLVGKKASELRKTIHDAGLGCESCHFNFRELKDSLDERIAWSQELGLKQMVLATFGVKPEAGMAEWVTACNDLNKISEKVQKAGMQTGFHNHNFEFKEIDGVLVYDKLMQTLEPKLVKMQFQVSVISLGFEAATFMTKYPGRFISMHLQDWSSADKKQVAVGQGSVDWKKTFAAAKTGGIKNYFVELNMDMLKASSQYLHDLKV